MLSVYQQTRFNTKVGFIPLHFFDYKISIFKQPGIQVEV